MAKQRNKRRTRRANGNGASESSNSEADTHQLSGLGLAASVVVVALAIAWQWGFFLTENSGQETRGDSLAEVLRDGEPSEDEVVRAWSGAAVDRVALVNMTHDRFRRDYLLPRRPVVLEGAYGLDPDERWSLRSIRRSYGDVVLKKVMIPPQTGVNENCSLAQLCRIGPTKLGSVFDETFFLSTKERRWRNRRGLPMPYPHDIRLRDTLPELFSEYRKLSYFAENWFLPWFNGVDSWPSIFFGAAGTRTGLHVDKHGTSFTMAVFRGRKQFLLFDTPDALKLCADDPLPASRYGIDAFDPDFERCPGARGARPLLASVGPGDLLYVPGSTVHAARNMEDGIGLAQNFLTEADRRSFVHSLISNNGKEDPSKGGKRELAIGVDDVALYDLFRLLEETGYVSDWSAGPLYLKADESGEEAHARLLTHCREVVLGKKDGARQYSTRVAFMAGPPFAVLALKAAGVWECLEQSKRDELLLDPDLLGDKNARRGVILALEHTKLQLEEQEAAECRRRIDEFSDALEKDISRAAGEMSRDGGLTTSSW